MAFFYLVEYIKEPSDQLIWSNKHLKIDNKSIFLKNFMDAGIWVIGDLFENGEIIDFHFWNNKGTTINNYLTWRSLIASIPKKWKNVKKDHKADSHNILRISKERDISKAKFKDFYWLIINNRYSLPSAQKHFKTIDINEIEWSDYYLIPHSYLKEKKAIDFQYRCLHRIIATNELMKRFRKIESPKCRNCDNIETYEH